MRPQIALARAWLAPFIRSRATVLLSVVFTLGVGASVPWATAVDLTEWLPKSHSVEAQPSAQPPPAIFNGRTPDWLRWPDETQGEAVVVSVRQDHKVDRPLFVLSSDDHNTARAQDVLDAAISAEAGRRLDALGIPDRPDRLVEIDSEELGPAFEVSFDQSGLLAAVLALWALVNAMNLLLLVPATDRASGALETLRATRLRPIQIAQAWWLLAAGFSMYIILTSGLGYLLASFAGFSMPVHAGILALPLFVAPTIALGVRVQARSHDLRASTFILVPYTYGALLLFGLAAWAHPLPLVAAAIPIGGALLFSLGGLPAFTLPVVVLASVGSTQAWLRSTANILEEDSDRVAGRHARRTHYTGAVLWLAAVASGANLLMQSHMALNDWPITVMTMSIVLCIGLPGALTPWLFGLSPRSVLQLGAPRPINWLLLPMLLCGTVGGGFLAMQGLLAWYPVDMRYLEEFSEVMAPMMSPLGIVLGSVIPGVCEELLFRGAMLGLLRRSGRIWGPIVLQAVLFAVFHAHFARLPPTFFIGLFLGVLAWRTGSIWPGVVVHTLHNAILIGASTYLVLEPAPPVDTTPYLVGMVLLGGLGLFLARGRPGISKE